jgi:hypothetical protein
MREDFMAKKKKRPSMRPVVQAIKATARDLKGLLRNASPAQKKKLKLKIQALGDLAGLAFYLCRNKKTLSS